MGFSRACGLRRPGLREVVVKGWTILCYPPYRQLGPALVRRVRLGMHPH